MKLLFSTSRSPEDVTTALAALFVRRGVGFQKVGRSLISTRIPRGAFDWQTFRVSRDNWVGANPFFSYSRVELTCVEAADGTGTVVHFEGSLQRTWFQAGCVSVAISFLGLADPRIPLFAIPLLAVHLAFVIFAIARGALGQEIRKAIGAP